MTGGASEPAELQERQDLTLVYLTQNNMTLLSAADAPVGQAPRGWMISVSWGQAKRLGGMFRVPDRKSCPKRLSSEDGKEMLPPSEMSWVPWTNVGV